MKQLYSIIAASVLLFSCSHKVYNNKTNASTNKKTPTAVAKNDPKLTDRNERKIVAGSPLIENPNAFYLNNAKAWSDTLLLLPQTQLKLDPIPETDDWLGTTNFNLRKPNLVIIHHTAQDSIGQTIRTFRLQRTNVSAHYVIAADGVVYHMLNDYLRAWHAGLGSWGAITDVNSISLGIELDNDGFKPFSEPQIASLIKLLRILKKKYNIPAANFIGHEDIAPARKDDPSKFFPWKRLADQGFGLWYDDTTNVQLPTGFDYIMALKMIGYDMKNVPAACAAFRRHFTGVDGGSQFLTIDEQKILYTLYRKYLFL